MRLIPPPALRFAFVVLVIYVVLPLYAGLLFKGIPGLVAVAVGLLSALYLYGDLPRRSVAHLPGPPSRWLTGNLSEFVKYGYHEFYGMVSKQYGPVAAVLMGTRVQVILSEPDLIKEVCLEKFDVFRDRPTMFSIRQSKGLLMAKGSHWQSSRRALNPAFNSIKLAAFADIISSHCEALVRRLGKVVDKKQGPIDVLRLFGDLSLDVIGSTSFDSDFRLQGDDPPSLDSTLEKNEDNQPETTASNKKEDIAQAARFIFANLAGPLGSGSPTQIFISVVFPFLGPLFRVLYPFLQTPESKDLWKSIGTLDKVTAELLEGRGQFSSTSPTSSDSKTKKPPVANFIDLIRKARDPDSGIGFDNREVRDQLNLFVLAGYETTANTLAYVAFLLAQNPKAEARLVDEIQRLAPDPKQRLSFSDLAEFIYTNAVVNEALRLYPPAAMLSRCAERDVVLGKDKKYLIRKGSAVVVPIYSIHRDEKFWKNPEEFDPERFLPERSSEHPKYAHLPFGLGPRNCIGQRFALEEAKLAVLALYRDYTLQLHEHTPVPLKLRAGLTLSPVDGIWMTVHRRKEPQVQ